MDGWMKIKLLLASCLALQTACANEEQIVALDHLSNEMVAYTAPLAQQKKSNKNGKSILANYNGLLYGGVALAYGRIVPGSNDSLLSSGLLEPLVTILQNIKSQQGGLSWRTFMGALVNVSNVVSMGTELGFTYYPETKGRAKPNLGALGNMGGDTLSGTTVGGSVSAHGYGIDLLYNVTFYLIPELYFAFKPGIQFAYQKNMIRFKFIFNDDKSSSDPTHININTKNKCVNTGLMPEVIVATGWIFRNNKWGAWNFDDYPLFVEFYYQHVFGNDSAPVTSRVSSRDAFGGSVGLRF